MFDILPNLLSSIITILFPIFASYKALRTSDPAQLTPWLMYWVVLSVFSLVESWTWFILSWLPFYAYIRLFILFYLVLPQTQGARLFYQQQIHPFLAHHESEIDKFIISAHDRARAAGLNYLKRAIDFVKENVLGIQPKARSAAETIPQGGTYAQNLLSRFNLPSARQGLAAPSGDFYGLLSAAAGALSTNSGVSREAQVEDFSKSGTLIPQNISSTTEKMTFLSTQRERLRVLLSALDKEASDLGTQAAIERDVDRRLAGDQLGEGLSKSRSEAEFEEIGKDELKGSKDGKEAGGGGYSLWGWGARAAAAMGRESDVGRSSGNDVRS